MARPQKCRCICSKPKVTGFEPDFGAKLRVVMGYDEYETLRLLDYEKFSQEQCAARMNVARTTVTRMYESARQKVADALVNGKRLVIEGGDVVTCAKIKPECVNVKNCCHKKKEECFTMKIAVTYENGEIFQHFGHTEHFKIYSVDNNKVVSSEIVATNGSGHGALAGFLQQNGVSCLICGGIGGGAKTALEAANITLYCGACGSADEAVLALLNNTLCYNPQTLCNHHSHEHGEGCGSGCGGSCGEHEN